MTTPGLDFQWNDRTSRRLWIGALALAAVLRVAFIERHGLWNNEFITIGVLRLPYPELVRERLSVNHMPLYFVLEKAWTGVFGVEEWSLRALAAIFGWMAVWATGRLARRIGGWSLALPVVFAAAIHQLWIAASLEARMYSILTWTAAESLDAYLAWMRPGELSERARRWSLVRWAVVGIVGLANHMLFAALLALESIDALVRWRRRSLPEPSRFAAAWLALLLACSPMAWLWAGAQNKFERAGRWEIQGSGVLHRQILRLLWGDFEALDVDALRAVGYPLMLAAIAGLTLELRRLRGDTARMEAAEDTGSSGRSPFSRDRYRDLLTLSMICLGFLIGIFVGAARSRAPILGQQRYYVLIAPAALVLGWTGLLHLATRWRRSAGALMAVAFVLMATYDVGHFASIGDGFREAVGFIENEASKGAGLVCVASGGAGGQLGRYYGAHLPRDILYVDRREDDAASIEELLVSYAKDHAEFWVLTYHEKKSPIWGFLDRHREAYAALGGRRQVGRTTIQRFRKMPATSGPAT